MRLELTPAVLERMILDGRLEAELRRRLDEAARDLADAQQEAAVEAGRSIASELSRQALIVAGLDLSDSALSRSLRAERERIVRNLTPTLLRAAVEARDRAAPRGLTAQARAVRDALGLTPTQAVAVERYRDLLERGSRSALGRARRDPDLDPDLEAALGEGERPSAGDVRRMSGAYRRNTLAAAALALAAFEAQQAQALGEGAALDQAVAAGSLEPVIWTWRTARDERVRPSHRRMEGQQRPDGQPFRSGDGNSLRFPGDPLAPVSDTARCRCVRTARAGVPAEQPVG